MVHVILEDTQADRIYSIGTAGGSRVSQRLGDSVITTCAQLDLQRPQNTVDVEPDLNVGLAQLSKRQLENFMRIELPDFLLKKANRRKDYPAISAFYQKLRRAIVDNADAVRAAVQTGGPANQVADNIGISGIQKAAGMDAVRQITDGIDEILEQGEGASCGTLFAGGGSEDETSHYFRFAEIYYGAGYRDPAPAAGLTLANQRTFFTGREIPWPNVKNTLAVPADGYARILALDPNGAAVTADLSAFDTAYSSTLAAVLSCFNIILRHQLPADLIARIPDLYPDELDRLRGYTDLTQPVFYGPRFLVGT